MGDQLSVAIEFAAEAHRGQVDKNGIPYILHPLHVMSKMETEAEMAAAVLHDVIEDAGVTKDELLDRGFTHEVVAAVVALTRNEGESWKHYIQRVSVNRMAAKIKIADLEHNMDIRRLGGLSKEFRSRLGMYHKAWKELKTIVGR